jgi:hypothetical protein
MGIHNDWNAAYRSEIIDRQSGNGSRDREVITGSLIDGSDLVIWCTKLAPDTYKRRITNLQSGNRGRDSKIMSGLPNNNK